MFLETKMVSDALKSQIKSKNKMKFKIGLQGMPVKDNVNISNNKQTKRIFGRGSIKSTAMANIILLVIKT